MKRIVMLSGLLACASLSFSQIHKGDCLIGGSASFSKFIPKGQTGIAYTSLVFNPDAGYFILNKLAGGLQYSYISTKVKGSPANSSHTYSPFARVGVTLGCLGLFGLSAVTASQRRKELNIRKVLGAGMSSIITLLSREFILLVLIAAAIAVPISIAAMHYWLQHFAYRITIGYAPVAGGVIIAIVIAAATVSIQTTKAALTNPVKYLR